MTIPRTLGAVAVGTVSLAGLVLASVDPFTLVFYVAYVGVSLVLMARQPRNLVAWVCYSASDSPS